MSDRGQIDLEAAPGRVLARHQGPLRLLKTLHPEGPGIAHAVLVHPPGGLVGGDRLGIRIDVQPGAHLLVTNPAATRFYRSIGPEASQTLQATVQPDARLEWLPQETLAYRGCRGRNEMRFALHGQLIAGELLALGLPESGEPFDTGEILQHLAIDGLWLDRGWIRAQDHALRHGPGGLDGHRVLGTLVLADAQPFEAEGLLEAGRQLPVPAGLRCGITHLHGRLLLARVLAQHVEPAQAWLRALRACWRGLHWGLAPCEPRVWRT